MSVAWPTAMPSGVRSAMSMSAAGWRARGTGARRITVATFVPTCLAAVHAAHVADHADERAAIDTGISFGRAFLVATGTADHRVVLGEFRHQRSSGERRQPSG